MNDIFIELLHGVLGLVLVPIIVLVPFHIMIKFFKRL